jgi:hypothetical protein
MVNWMIGFIVLLIIMLGFIVWKKKEGIRDSMERVRTYVRTHYNRQQSMSMHPMNGIIQPTNRERAAYLSKLDDIRPKDSVVFTAGKAAATSGIINPSFIGAAIYSPPDSPLIITYVE